MKQKLIIGLGNPGSRYQKTRHNLGFQVLDALALTLGLTFKNQARFSAATAHNHQAGQKLLLAKPLTYMNRSGRAVATLRQYYKLPPDKMLIVHDEIDLPFGRLRLSGNSGPAGHKGIISVIAALGQQVPRLRIGIDNREGKNHPDTETYVLQNFTREEARLLKNHTIPAAIAKIEEWIAKNH